MTTKANPQLENGFTMIADELLEALIAARLSGQEHRVVWAVIRKTYGFGKKMDRISMGQFEKMTRIPNKRCHRTMKKLIEKNVIVKGGSFKEPTYGLQKNYLLWSLDDTPLTGGTPQEGGREPSQGGVEVPPQGGATINNINTKQERRGGKRSLPQRFSQDSWQIHLADEFHAQLTANGNIPSRLSKDWSQEWANVLDKCHRLDRKPIEAIRRTVLYPQTQTEPKYGTNFCWADNFTTLNKLRRPLKGSKDETYFDRLERESRRATRGQSDGTAQGRISPDDPYRDAYR